MPVDHLTEMALCSECGLNIMRYQGFKVTCLMPNGRELTLWLCLHCLPYAIWKRTEEERERSKASEWGF